MEAQIFAVFILVLAVLAIIAHIRVRMQTAERAATLIRQKLHGKRNLRGRVEVMRWGMRPLSDHMIKDIAEREGFAFHGTRGSGGSGATFLEFTPPPPRKLSIDD